MTRSAGSTRGGGAKSHKYARPPALLSFCKLPDLCILGLAKSSKSAIIYTTAEQEQPDTLTAPKRAGKEGTP